MATGERIVRIPPNLTARERGTERTRGKSDPIDARAIARAALREGIDTLPTAHLDQVSLEIKLLLDHREDLTKACSQDQQRLRWHLHDLWPDLKIPVGALDRAVWLERIARKLSRAEHCARVRIARDLVRALKQHTRRAHELEREITTLVQSKAPQLLELAGCGALTAAKILAETAGRGALQLRRQARTVGRSGTDTRILREKQSPPPRPRRQPPTQLRATPNRNRARTHTRARTNIPRQEGNRGKDTPRSTTRTKATPRTRDLARPTTTPSTRPGAKKAPGGAPTNPP